MSIKLSSSNTSQKSVKDSWNTQTLGVANNNNLIQKSPYQADQQVKYLSLEAEVEFLLQELRTIHNTKVTASPELAKI